MEDYEKVLQRNITTQKISQQTSVMPNIKKGDEKNGGNKDFKNMLKENYQSKQLQWKVENFQQDNMEKLDKERRKETKMFLNQFKKRPRFAQEFVDSYSLRDNTVNENIIQMNKVLGKHFYDKKRLNKKIDEYLNEIDKRSREVNDNSILNSVKANKDDELRRKIQDNLAREKEEHFDIQFGKKENEIVIALVNSAKITGTQYFKEEKNDFQDFVSFREKVIAQEKEKETEALNKIKSSDNKRNKTVKDIRRNSYNFDTNNKTRDKPFG